MRKFKIHLFFELDDETSSKRKSRKIIKDELVQCLKFIKEPENEGVEKFMKENKYLKQAKKELEHLSGDPDFKRLLESRVGFLRDEATQMAVAKQEGERHGMKKGRKEGRKEYQLLLRTIPRDSDDFLIALNAEDDVIEALYKKYDISTND